MKRFRWAVMRHVLLMAVGIFAARAEASQSEAEICSRVAATVAQQSGVPVSVLRAITLTETGRKLGGAFQPWPWTVNMEGKGHWFDTQDQARAFVFKEFKRGARSFDVGCFQINYKWHGEAFASIDEMFDPLANAQYAARFLRDLHTETGSWSKAAGAYHSRTPEFANRYAARFDRIRATLAPEEGPDGGAPLPDREIPEIPDIVLAANGPAPQDRAERVNRYPLLIRKTAAPASLGGAPGASLFAAAVARMGQE